MPIPLSPERRLVAEAVQRLQGRIGDEAEVVEWTGRNPLDFDRLNLPFGGALVLVAISQVVPQEPDVLAGDQVWQDARFELALQLVVRQLEGPATCVDLAAACRDALVGWVPDTWGQPFTAGSLQVQQPGEPDLWAYVQLVNTTGTWMHGPTGEPDPLLESFTLGPLGGPATEHTADA